MKSKLASSYLLINSVIDLYFFVFFSYLAQLTSNPQSVSPIKRFLMHARYHNRVKLRGKLLIFFLLFTGLQLIKRSFQAKYGMRNRILRKTA